MKFRRLAGALIIALPATFTLYGSSPANASGCTPAAQPPSFDGNGGGAANGSTSGCAGVTYSWEIRLSASGSDATLSRWTGTITGNGSFRTPPFGYDPCGGLVVRSWIYINVGGVGKSAQSNYYNCW
jgi:hypothetical protein